MSDQRIFVDEDRYNALLSMEGRVNALADILKMGRSTLTTLDVLTILGFEADDVRESNADRF